MIESRLLRIAVRILLREEGRIQGVASDSELIAEFAGGHLLSGTVCETDVASAEVGVIIPSGGDSWAAAVTQVLLTSVISGARAGWVGSGDEVTITNENHQWAGLISARADEIAQRTITVKAGIGEAVGDDAGGCEVAGDGLAGISWAASITWAEQNFRGSEFSSNSLEVTPALGRISEPVKTRIATFVVVCEQTEGDTDLFQVTDAVDTLSAGFGFCQRRQEHTGQNCDDSDNDEQFNQGECSF